MKMCNRHLEKVRSNDNLCVL